VNVKQNEHEHVDRAWCISIRATSGGEMRPDVRETGCDPDPRAVGGDPDRRGSRGGRPCLGQKD